MALKKWFQMIQGFPSVCVSHGQVLLPVPESDFCAGLPSVMAGLFEGALAVAGDSPCFVLVGRVIGRE